MNISFIGIMDYIGPQYRVSRKTSFNRPVSQIWKIWMLSFVPFFTRIHMIPNLWLYLLNCGRWNVSKSKTQNLTGWSFLNHNLKFWMLSFVEILIWVRMTPNSYWSSYCEWFWCLLNFYFVLILAREPRAPLSWFWDES